MLFYEVKNVNNIEKVDTNLSVRFINGRYIMDGNRVILYTIFPLLNETFVREQIKQGLSEIWDMNNVLKSVSQENEQPNQ